MTESDDPGYAFTEGWRRGERDPSPITEDDLIALPPRLRLAFLRGYDAYVRSDLMKTRTEDSHIS